ncbi:hypothetical protein XH88_01690 [Bradyrhizobium sp. CCBAU 51627]|nr:hypothetical protein [Bradyrhizobium sp. CCBAU 51627]
MAGDRRPKDGVASLAYVPPIHALPYGAKNVDARAFASPQRLRPRRRDKPGHDDVEALACFGPMQVQSIGQPPHDRATGCVVHADASVI